MKNYYLILGVSRRADGARIKHAFREIAKQHHPDVAGSDGSTDRFRQVQEAYEVLADETKRKRYDEALAREEEREPPVRRRRGMKRYHFRPGGGDPASSLVDNLLNDLFAGMLGPRMGGEREIYFELILSPLEAERGGACAITLPLVKSCPACTRYWEDLFCPLCGGRGKLYLQEDLTFCLPPQVDHGTELRLSLHRIGLPGNYLNIVVHIDFSRF